MASVRKVQCVVSSVTDHGQQVYGVKLEPQERLPRFSAGQFLHLTLDPYDPASFWPESRVFSIASSPSRTEPLEILYSVKGRYTARMEQELKPGAEVWVKLPYGEFVLDDLDKPRVLFAGGTGISAFTSLLNAIHKSGQSSPLWLVYGIRNQQLFFYREVIEALARDGLCEKIFLFVENGEPGEADGPLQLASGRIDFDAIWPELKTETLPDFYLAGPPAMLSMLTEKLRAQHVSEAQIHVDAWE
jgi:ferredoxin-NADP reductase